MDREEETLGERVFGVLLVALLAMLGLLLMLTLLRVGADQVGLWEYSTTHRAPVTRTHSPL